MAYAIAHSATNSGSSGTASVTITSPTKKNLLVVYVMTLGIPQTVAGWNEDNAVTVGTEIIVQYSKISDGTESSFSATVNPSQPWSCVYAEVSGFNGTAILDTPTAAATTSSVTSQGVSENTNNIHQFAIVGFGWDPPRYGFDPRIWTPERLEAALAADRAVVIDGQIVPLVRGGTKMAGSFTTPSGWTLIATITTQVNAATAYYWQDTGAAILSTIVTGQYSVSGPATAALGVYGNSAIEQNNVAYGYGAN